MGSIVADIETEVRSITATVLGSTYTRLQEVYEIEKNVLRGIRLGYGIRPLGAEPSEGVLRAFTLTHEFELILTDTIARRAPASVSASSELESTIDTLFNKAEEVMKQLVNTKINLSSTVLWVSQPTYLEPQIFDGSKMVVLRTRFQVKYRINL